MRDVESIRRGLDQNPDKTEFCDRTGGQLGNAFLREFAYPTRDSPMKFVLQKSQCDECIHVEKILHGNSARISRTCLLLSNGASKPALSTGRPVTGSTMILAFRERGLRGVNTMRPPSTSVSRRSPVCRPSFRRICTGNTTCPFVESLVFMVRQSYLICLLPAT